MVPAAIRPPSASIPVVMSLLAICAVLYQLARFGAAPQADEGTAAHIWQLLMAGQVPIIGYYALRWVPRVPRMALAVVAAQVLAALAAMAPVFLLGW